MTTVEAIQKAGDMSVIDSTFGLPIRIQAFAQHRVQQSALFLIECEA